MTNITSIAIDPELFEWIKTNRLNFSEYVRKKIIEDMQREQHKALSLEDKLADAEQQQVKAENLCKTLTEQKARQDAEENKLKEQEQAKVHERLVKGFLDNSIYPIIDSTTPEQIRALIHDYIRVRPNLKGTLDGLIPDFEVWLNQQKQIKEIGDKEK